MGDIRKCALLFHKTLEDIDALELKLVTTMIDYLTDENKTVENLLEEHKVFNILKKVEEDIRNLQPYCDIDTSKFVESFKKEIEEPLNKEPNHAVFVLPDKVMSIKVSLIELFSK